MNIATYNTLSTQLQAATTSTEKAQIYSQLAALDSVWTAEGEELLDQAVFLSWFHMFLSTYLLQNIMQYVFARIRGKSVKILFHELAINTICTLIVTYIIIVYYAHYKHIEVADERYRAVTTMNKIIQDKYTKFQFLFAILTAAQWVRVFFIIRASKFLGPMIHILLNVFTQVGKFMIGIYLVMFLVFLSMGKIMFLELDEFESTGSAIATLFSASLGEFDFAIFRASMNLEDGIGYVYLITFLLLISIIALNFAIAILSQRFDELQKIKNGLYLQQIIMIRQVSEKDSVYSGIVSAFAPINIFNVPLSLLICIKKNKRVNSVALHIFYIPVLLLGTLCFLVISLLLLPLGYLGSVILQLKSL